MKSNALLKWLMIPVMLLIVWGAVKLLSDPDDGSKPSSNAGTDNAVLSEEEMKALGIEGDTSRDTIATLVAQVKQLRGELGAAFDASKQNKAENERLRQREGAVDQRIENALRDERERLRAEREQAADERRHTQNALQALQRRLDTQGGQVGHADLPIGLGLNDGETESFPDRGLRWIEPLDTAPANRSIPSTKSGQAGASTFPTRFKPALDRVHEVAASKSLAGETEDKPAQPVYTIPSNATLIGSVAMTALIGRVPIDGTVNDPYPFKVLIGADNLTANGIQLPDVAGAVVNGTASGDWTLSCVRGQIRSITFVFRDGTVRTIPSDSATGGGATQGNLGWISDPHGIPCVSGKRRSNGQQYLTSQMLVTAAGAGAASLIESDTGNVSYVSSNGSTLGTVGITGNEAMGRILAGGVNEMSQWVNKLYGQAFAAVYVPPGAHVAVHIEQPLNIDYDPDGRRVDHRTGETHVSELD